MYASSKNTKGDLVTKRTKEGAAKRKNAEKAFLKMAQAQHKARNRKTYAAPKPKD